MDKDYVSSVFYKLGSLDLLSEAQVCSKVADNIHSNQFFVIWEKILLVVLYLNERIFANWLPAWTWIDQHQWWTYNLY